MTNLRSRTTPSVTTTKTTESSSITTRSSRRNYEGQEEHNKQKCSFQETPKRAEKKEDSLVRSLKKLDITPKPESMEKDRIKLRVRKSMIARGRKNASLGNNGDLQSPKISEETPNRRSTRLTGNSLANTPMRDVMLGGKRKSHESPKIVPNKKCPEKKLTVKIRKSLVSRYKPAESDQSETDSESSESCQEEGEGCESELSTNAVVEPLTGREEEFISIDTWISESLKVRQALTVYISGSPGTGKTATLRLLLRKWSNTALSTIINCVQIQTQKDLIETVFRSQKLSERPTLKNFEDFLATSKKPLILVLDEIDHLATNTNSLLYSAFKWPQELTHRLIVIGIANSIDLTERLLPKLKLSRPPKTLVFRPYSKDTIKRIIEKKMKNDETQCDSKAIELIGRKVAAMSGDLRKALHVANATRDALASPNAAGCREVLGVLSNVYSSPLARARLPLQPRLLLAVCLCMSENKKTNLTRSSLFSQYSKACDTVKVPPLENDDLQSALQTLESQSFVSITSNGHIRLQVDGPTARGAISDRAMIDQISVLYA